MLGHDCSTGSARGQHCAALPGAAACQWHKEGFSSQLQEKPLPSLLRVLRTGRAPLGQDSLSQSSQRLALQDTASSSPHLTSAVMDSHTTASLLAAIYLEITGFSGLRSRFAHRQYPTYSPSRAQAHKREPPALIHHWALGSQRLLHVRSCRLSQRHHISPSQGLPKPVGPAGSSHCLMVPGDHFPLLSNSPAVWLKAGCSL